MGRYRLYSPARCLCVECADRVSRTRAQPIAGTSYIASDQKIRSPRSDKSILAHPKDCLRELRGLRRSYGRVTRHRLRADQGGPGDSCCALREPGWDRPCALWLHSADPGADRSQLVFTIPVGLSRGGEPCRLSGRSARRAFAGSAHRFGRGTARRNGADGRQPGRLCLSLRLRVVLSVAFRLGLHRRGTDGARRADSARGASGRGGVLPVG